MYHYKLTPDQVWALTDEQKEMLVYGLAWLKIIKIKTSDEDSKMRGWEHLKRLVK